MSPDYSIDRPRICARQNRANYFFTLPYCGNNTTTSIISRLNKKIKMKFVFFYPASDYFENSKNVTKNRPGFRDFFPLKSLKKRSIFTLVKYIFCRKSTLFL